MGKYKSNPSSSDHHLCGLHKPSPSDLLWLHREKIEGIDRNKK